MSTSLSAMPTMSDVAWPSRTSSPLLRSVSLVLAGTAVLTISSKLQVPFYPVPITLQTFLVLMIGMAYGWRLGGITMLCYLAEGVIGLPVFAGTPEKGLGIAYMLGGTGGYLIGFVPAAIVCGWLAEKGWDRRPLTAAAAMSLGTAAIYLPGLTWLGTLFGWDKPILAWGLYPFLAGDVFKILLGTAMLPLAWRLLGRR
ncbi:MAG: biotin transporter BioY [Proteobacteria bacterium]|nr:MAG: biotin transporter BioY [Pseudomonadota bacterium]